MPSNKFVQNQDPQFSPDFTITQNRNFLWLSVFIIGVIHLRL